jgi:hypothetical protein
VPDVAYSGDVNNGLLVARSQGDPANVGDILLLFRPHELFGSCATNGAVKRRSSAKQTTKTVNFRHAGKAQLRQKQT